MQHFTLTNEARDALKADLITIYEEAKVNAYEDAEEFHRVLGYLVRERLPKEAQVALERLRGGKGDPVLHFKNLPQDDDINREVNLVRDNLERHSIPDKSYISEYVLLGLTAAANLRVQLSPSGNLPINQKSNQNPRRNRNATGADDAGIIEAMAYHTDYGDKFEFMLLYCLQGNPKAQTSFITANSLVESLRHEGADDIIEILKQPLFYNPNADEDPHPVLKEIAPNEWHIHLVQDHDYFRANTEEGKRALTFLETFIPAKCAVEPVNLEAGEIVMSSNLRTIHNQEVFTTSLDRANARWLQRALGNTYEKGRW